MKNFFKEPERSSTTNLGQSRYKSVRRFNLWKVMAYHTARLKVPHHWDRMAIFSITPGGHSIVKFTLLRQMKFGLVFGAKLYVFLETLPLISFIHFWELSCHVKPLNFHRRGRPTTESADVKLTKLFYISTFMVYQTDMAVLFRLGPITILPLKLIS
ncbi:hypothetical protein HOLleu_32502 [Holothuria leucospilota]|uniref:Uncharacterized protein n=1 Tax=Holothuria leucospilota TaxID=206669 RepID=A0A9Q1GXY0_HOLLE|nr:hypothetical protein HOLleu_32502 [Holothuria leucospilota]